MFRGWPYLRKARDRDSQPTAAAKRLLFCPYPSRSLFPLALLSIYPRNHIGKYGVQLKAIQRDRFGHVHRHGKRASRRDRKRDRLLHISEHEFNRRFEMLNCLAFAIGVLLYYVKSSSSLESRFSTATVESFIQLIQVVSTAHRTY